MKTKSIILLIFPILLLGAFSYYLFTNDSNSSGTKPFSDFAIEKTEEITKIIITEVNGNHADLELVNGEWRINEKFKARPENVELLLKTFRRISVQSAVPKEALRNITTNIAARNRKVEIFMGGKKAVKTYYVGSPTKDHYGTYMILKKGGKMSSTPYIMHLPGFNGFLESRFYSDENEWKYSGVFNYDLKDIATVKLENIVNLSESFQISSLFFKPKLLEVTGAEIEGGNDNLIQSYFQNFEKIHYNRIAEFSQERIDSVKALEPHFVVTVFDKKGNENQVKFYKKANDYEEIDIVTGRIVKWDADYILGCNNDNNEILVFQYYALGNMFAKKTELTRK